MRQNSSPPLLVFDLDGTLADTAGDLIGTLNMILAREGLPGVTLADARALVGGGAKALIRRGLALHKIVPSEARLDAMLSDFMTHYEAHIADNTVLFPGVAAALDRFGAAGFAFAVCTNKVEHASIRLLRALGIFERFRAVCGKDTFAVNKPNGEALLQTIARAGGVRGRAVMIGDSKTDIETARNAVVPVVAVNFGYTEEPVELFKPDRIVGHYDELWDAVEGLRIMESRTALTSDSLLS